MKRSRKTLLALVALTPIAALAAGTGMKPGQWEYQAKMEMPGMPFAMPPVTSQRCLTQAEIERGEQYSKDEENDCQLKNLKQTASSATYDVACKDGTTGRYEFTYGADSMQGKGVTESQGQKVTMHFNAKRVGDCK